MEQYREPLAYNAFTHNMLVESSIKYKQLFDKLISQKKMKPFDTACFAHALSCTTLCVCYGSQPLSRLCCPERKYCSRYCGNETLFI